MNQKEQQRLMVLNQVGRGELVGKQVAELRLAGAKTIEKANRVLGDFLPRYNARFGVPRLKSGKARLTDNQSLPSIWMRCCASSTDAQ